MNETYRRSKGLPTHQFAVALILALGFLAVATIKSIRGGTRPSIMYFSIALAALSTLSCWRIHKLSALRLRNHALVLAEDAVLISDGAKQLRIPYDTIELLRIR